MSFQEKATLVEEMLGPGASTAHFVRPVPDSDVVQRATEVISPGELVALMLEKQRELDEAGDAYRDAMQAEALAEHDYRVAKAAKWSEAVRTLPIKTTASHKESWVQGETAALRRARDLTIADAKAEMERVRNIRQELSSLQSIANAIREEVAMARVGPELKP